MSNIAKIILFLLVFLVFPILVFAKDKAEPRLITVFGDAEVRVVPDEVILRLEIETLNKDLTLAKRENDERTKKVMDVARKHKIKEKNIQTDYISIRPEYDYRSNGRDEFIGYEVSNYIVIEIKDISKFEAVLSDVLDAGANYLHDVVFRTTELRKYKDQARSLAIKAAKEKAVKLADELGQEVGEPYMIQEDGVQSNPWQNIGSPMGPQMTVSSGRGSSVSGDSIAPGQIKITAKIIVSFELE